MKATRVLFDHVTGEIRASTATREKKLGRVGKVTMETDDAIVETHQEHTIFRFESGATVEVVDVEKTNGRSKYAVIS